MAVQEKTGSEKSGQKQTEPAAGKAKGFPGIVFAAAECRGLAKIGGLGDVVRDLAGALVDKGYPARVIMPYYEALPVKMKSESPDSAESLQAEFVAALRVRFAGRDEDFTLCRTVLPDNVPVYLIKSDIWFSGVYGAVYVDSGKLGHGPFEDDTTRFAFFSAAALECIRSLADFADVRVVHCHDWHTAFLLTLLKYDPLYASLHVRLKTLFTIHNLDYQGARPWQGCPDGRPGSFESWFPEVFRRIQDTGDCALYSSPYDAGCFNPMRAAIKTAGMVSTVSPSYAREITQPDVPARNFVGGRGLEGDLAVLAENGRLPGILNGIDYAQHDPGKAVHPYDADMPSWRQNRRLGREEFIAGLPSWIEALAEKHGAGFRNSSRLVSALGNFEPPLWKNRALFTAVTRVATQKFGLLFSRMPDGRNLLEHFLDRPLALIVLGSGELEGALNALTERPNALFLDLFDAETAARLYQVGDVFLMPSDFEPCGISQLISMRYGCLPLVHDIGGLHDTVRHGETGFVYSGGSLAEQQKAFLRLTDDILWFRENSPDEWASMQENAMRTRFTWSEQAEKYLEIYSSL